MKLLSFDVESNGLHGEAFAVGAILYDTDTCQVESSVCYRMPIAGQVDDWVSENVLPQLVGVEITHDDAQAMRRDFWNWYLAHKDGAIVIVDVGYPVEARFLAACQDDDASRKWQGPYPLHEVATMLQMAGVDPDTDRIALVGDGLRGLQKHNPIDDAHASAIVAGWLLTGHY